MKRYTTTYDSPIGLLRLVSSDDALVGIWHSNQPKDDSSWIDDPSQTILFRTVSQLNEYFDRQLTEFDIPVAPEGTEFQESVWQILQEIPFGQTRSYAWVAEKLNNPKAVRAVGAANGANPISIVIPCHRVIGKNGTLTGYAGGLNKKETLLSIEQGGILPLI